MPELMKESGRDLGMGRDVTRHYELAGNRTVDRECSTFHATISTCSRP